MTKLRKVGHCFHLVDVGVVGEVGERTVTGELSVFMGTTPLEARDSYLQNKTMKVH